MAIFDFGNRRFDEVGNCFLKTEAIMELMYQGKNLEDYNFIVDMSDADIKAYNRNNISKKLTNDNYQPVNIEERRNEWFYPTGYDDLDLRVFFENMCKTDEEKERALGELHHFEEKGLEKFLRFCIYLAVVLKQGNIVHGVGRGSSCACFLLFLLGINKVNPLVYGLEIEEFLK